MAIENMGYRAMPTGIVQKKAGQSQKLTSLLRDLVRRYPKTIGIFSEFLQNADDSQATVVRFILDHRTFAATRLPSPQMSAMLGPALLICNDSKFTEEDFERIQQIGDSGKLMAVAKTGRFGFGFNSAYNITDYPSFISGQWLYIFDPHKACLPDGEPGVAYTLTPELWSAYPDLLAPFASAGVAPGTLDHQGTVFRLPLRTPEQAPHSEIRTEPFTPEDFHALTERFADSASGALVFLKHVLRAEIHEIDAAATQRELLLVTTSNSAEVVASRAIINSVAMQPHPSLLETLATQSPRAVFEHKFSITRGKTESSARWLIATGIYFDGNGELKESAKAMFAAGEKAVPWVGVALSLDPLSECCRPLRISGQAYSFLPLPIETGLPVHINGFFDLGSDRRTLTHDPNSVGRDELRVRWNAVLCRRALPLAYRDVVLGLIKRGALPDLDYYNAWPDCGAVKEEPLRAVATGFYEIAQAEDVVMAAMAEGQAWRPVLDLWVPPADNPLLQEALVADGFGVPHPPLPHHVICGFEAAGIEIDHLTPEDLRVALRTKADVATGLENAPRACLRRREWVEALLRYCLSDPKSNEQLAGLPLALLEDGKLHTFGYFNKVAFLAGDTERRLLTGRPHWFFDKSFAVSVGLAPSNAGGVAQMTPATFAQNLPAAMDTSKGSDPVPWEPDAKGAPGAPWLTDLFVYLTEHHKDVLVKMQEWKTRPPLLPDQNQHLCPPGLATSPLLVPTELASNRRLLRALDSFSVPRVKAPGPLLDAIAGFAQATSGKYILSLTGPTLAAALSQSAPKWNGALATYQPELHDVLLDFLSEERWLTAPGGLNPLKALTLFPTEDNALVTVTAPDVYFTPDTPPSVSCKVKLLKLGRQGRWKPLLKALGAKPLDNATLIRDVLLPQFAGSTDREQIAILRWLRAHLRDTVRYVEAVSPQAASELRDRVAKARLFRCEDSSLHAAVSVYSPHDRLARDVLGKSVAFVDAGTFGAEWDEWHAFLQYLGMPAGPTPQDLLGAVDAVAASEPESPETANRIERLLEHFGNHLALLSDAQVVDPANGTASRSLGEAVADRAWLRAESDQKRLGRFAGAVPAEIRLYRPRELVSARVGQLCASQRPLSAHTKVRAELARAIGMSSRVSDDVVLSHFERLLALWDGDGHGGLTPQALEASLKRIYARLGGATEESDDEDDQQEGAVPPADAPMTDLAARFATRHCLWDWEKKDRFWPAMHVFRTRVPCFGTVRTSMRFNDLPLERGYEALGRRDEPTGDDVVRFLQDVATAFPEGVPASMVPHLLTAEAKLAQAVAAGAPRVPLEEFPLLAAELRMVPADAAYYCDAEWHRDRLEPGRVALLYHPGTDYGLVRHLGVRTLSVDIHERLLEAGARVSDLREALRCSGWQVNLRSPEFRVGLERVIRCNSENEDLAVDLAWLADVRIEPVEHISTELLLDRGAGPMVVGTGKCEVFVQSHQGTGGAVIYLACGGDARLELLLTRGLMRQLAPLQIDRQLELREIITSEPSDIEATLTRLRVPRVKGAEPTIEGMDAGSEATDLPIDVSTVDLPETGERDDLDDVPSENLRSAGEAVEAESDGQEDRETDGLKLDDVEADETAQDAPATFRVEHNDPSPPVQQPDARKAPGITPPASPVPASVRPAQTDPRVPPDPTSPRRDEEDTSIPSGPRSATPPPPGERRRPPGPPVIDSHGQRTPSQRPPRPRRGRALTYMVPEGEAFKTPHDPADDEQPVNMKIGQSAVDHALKYEREVLGRTAEPQDHNNKGYDILSTAKDGSDLRYIEVKGIDGPWSEDGVPVSKSQFEMGQQFKGAYWLYVVENARTAEAVVHRIQDPANKVTQFRYDMGWRGLAAPASPTSDETLPHPVHPAVGGRIRWSDGRAGKIRAVQQRGKFSFLEVMIDDGTNVRGLFDPTRMTLIQEA